MSVVPGELTTFQWETTLGPHKPVLKDEKKEKKSLVGRERGVDLRRVLSKYVVWNSQRTN